MDCFSLANAMAAILGLFVHRRVPISIIKDNTVGSCQVDTDATTSRGRDETKELRVEIEPVYHFLTSFYFDRAV